MAIITHNCEEETKTRIDYLNDTLLELIFTRLILWRNLAVSKCVSKRWNSIISNPDFTRQLPLPCLPSTLVLSDGKCLVSEHPYFQKHKFALDLFPSTLLNIVASTNELIVVYRLINDSQKKREFYVVNPLTKQYVVVPIPSATPICQFWQIMVGIAGFLDGFRIVRVIGGIPKSTVQIYSSETGQWMTYLLDRFKNPGVKFGPSATWNNKIHWMDYSKLLVVDPFKNNNEALRVVDLPTEIHSYNSKLGICQNRLRITQLCETRWSDDRKYPSRIKIWEIEDYNNLGTNNYVNAKLVIDLELKRSILNRIISHFPFIYCCHPTDPQVVYLSINGNLFRYNVVEKKCKLSMVPYTSPIHAFVLAHPP